MSTDSRRVVLVAICVLSLASIPRWLRCDDGMDSHVSQGAPVHARETARSIPAALERRQPVVFRQFPTSPDLFQDDLRPLIADIIARHGEEEWAAAVICNELHRHLGIYSLIGVKMGTRARELLGASLDDIRVESSAGQQPPVSCLNDGLQVSTGASLGRGTISILPNSAPTPEALFISGGRCLRLRTKSSVIAKIDAEVQALMRQHGDNTPAYMGTIRELALRCWVELDRAQIFDEGWE
ncbi:MAG: formylmethanofuran dehydrogenase subunit E family protein [Acidobacteriota bacterium]